MSSGFVISRRFKLLLFIGLLAFSVTIALLGRFLLKLPAPYLPKDSVKDAKISGGNYGVSINGTLTPELVEIPGGRFLMGSGPDVGSAAEHPRHLVTLNKFLISRFEITNAQYQAFCKATGHTMLDPKWQDNYLPTHLDYPVANVTWQDAVDYCQWLSRVIGREVRLPTEAEWEKAAEGSTPGRTLEVAAQEAVPVTKVGTYSPNQYGLYDMLGNLSEWCSDWYSPQYYSESPEQNPRGPESGQFHVLRGGSWADRAEGCRISSRSQIALTSPTVGFRVVAQSR